MRVSGLTGGQPWWATAGQGSDVAVRRSEPSADRGSASAASVKPAKSAPLGEADPAAAFAGLTPDAAGRIDFTSWPAAGIKTGVLPESATLASISFAGVGSVTWFGAVGADEEAQDPSQQADLPRGTLTAIQFQFDAQASAADRAMLTSLGLNYASDVSTGATARWSPHALYPITVAGEAATARWSSAGDATLDHLL